MVCSPANGYVAIPVNVFQTFFVVLAVVAIYRIAFELDRHVFRPGFRLKKRDRDWE